MSYLFKSTTTKIGDKYMLGKKFKEKYDFKELEFVKLLTYNATHNGMTFKKGLNEDKVTFLPYGQCNPGGIYFIRITDVLNWLNYNGKCMAYYMFVENIPNDAETYVENDKFKASKLILSEKYDLREYLLKTYRMNQIITQLSINYSCNREEVKDFIEFYFSDQEEKKTLELIKKDSNYYCFVINKTPSIMMAAIHRGFNYVLSEDIVTDEMRVTALHYECKLIRYIKDPSKDIIISTVRSFNEFTKNWIVNKLPNYQIIQNAINSILLKETVDEAFTLLNSVETPEYFIKSFKNELTDLKKHFNFIDNKCTEFITTFCKIIYEKLCYKFVKKSWKNVKFITPEFIIDIETIYMNAIDQSYEALCLINNDIYDTTKLCMYAISKSPNAIKLIKNPTEEMLTFASMKNN
jgi:hypothetical protein